jgi:hypothetical protein
LRAKPHRRTAGAKSPAVFRALGKQLMLPKWSGWTLADKAGLSSAMVPYGPFRSTEAFASLLHCAPSQQVSLTAQAPTATDSA